MRNLLSFLTLSKQKHIRLIILFYSLRDKIKIFHLCKNIRDKRFDYYTSFYNYFFETGNITMILNS